MTKTAKFATLCCFAAVAGMVSCVSLTDELDLDKDLSLEVQLAPDGMTVPLGSLDRIYIDSLLKIQDGSVLALLDGRTYGLSIDGTIDAVNADIEDLTIDIPSPSLSPISVSFTEMTGIDINVSTDKFKADVSQTSKLSIETETDKALLSVRKVDLSEPSAMAVNVALSGIPASTDTLILENLTVSLPSFITPDYHGSDSRISVSGSNVIVNGKLVRDAGELTSYTIPLTISGLDFGEPVATVSKDGKNVLAIDGDIVISGTFKLGGATVNLSELNSITATPTIAIAPLNVKSVTGVVSPSIEPIEKSVSIDLGEDSEFLTSSANRLSLSDPQVVMNLTSSITVPLEVSLTLSSKDKDGKYIVKDIMPDGGTITVPACPAGMPSKTTVFVLGRNSRPVGGDTIFVAVSSLSDLLTTIPKTVLFNMAVSTDGTEQTIDLTRDLSVSGTYKVSVPMSFNDLYLEYTQTIDGLASDLKDISDKTGAVTLNLKAKVESTLPLGLQITALPFTTAGLACPGITISTCSIAAGSSTPVTSDLNLEIKADAGALKNLDNLELKAACSASSAVLKKGQYIQIKDMSLSIPEGGITLDFTDSIDK